MSNPAPQPRPQPASMDIEAAVLGTVMLEPALLDDLPPILPHDFYWESHKNLWRIISELRAAGRSPQTIAVRDEIEARGWQSKTAGMDETGNPVNGIGYLDALGRCAYTPAFAESVSKLLELSQCRRGIDLCHSTAASLQAGTIRALSALERLTRDAAEILQSGTLASEAADVAGFAQDEANTLIEYQNTAGAAFGAPTGFLWLDAALCGGWQPEDFALMAGRPGTGKSKVGLYMLASSCRAGNKSGYISLDMGKKRLAPYIIPAFCNTFDGPHITGREVAYFAQDGPIGEQRLRDAVDFLRSLPRENSCRVVAAPKSYSLAAVAGYIRELAQDGCKVILLDQLQGIGEWADGAMNRGVYQRIFHELRNNLARRYQVSLIVLHQIGRAGTERPSIDSLKDTGCAEEATDIVLLLHDYQKVLLMEHGEFVVENDMARAPKKGEIGHGNRKALTRRIISVDLAKSRSSAVERQDSWFDYSLGIGEG